MRRLSSFLFKGKAMLLQLILLVIFCSCSRESQQEPSLQKDDINVQVQQESLTAIAANSKLIYEETFEGAVPFHTYVGKQFAASYSFTTASSPVFAGSKSGRFELRDTDPMKKSGTRAEISFPEVSGTLDRWYAFSVYFPSNDYKYDSEDEIINQWHQGGGVSPALTLGVKMDRYRLIVKPTATTSHKLDLGPVVKDKWNTFVFHIKHSSGADGLLELWLNGVKIVDRKGVNMYELSSGEFSYPKWKLGVYKSDWNRNQTTDVSKRVLYYDNIRLGNELASYADMTSEGGNLPTQSMATHLAKTPQVTSLVLVDASTEKDVLTVANGASISLAQKGISTMTFRANTAFTAGSVKLELTGPAKHTSIDNAAPYTLFGDNGKGNYHYGTLKLLPPGVYTLKATSYSGRKATGIAGTPYSVTFTVTK